MGGGGGGRLGVYVCVSACVSYCSIELCAVQVRTREGKTIVGQGCLTP